MVIVPERILQRFNENNYSAFSPPKSAKPLQAPILTNVNNGDLPISTGVERFGDPV
jgi:hypothetical protein